MRAKPMCLSVRREGSTLLVTIIAMAILGALSAGVFVASWREAQIGATSILRTRALAAAEFGAYSALTPLQWRSPWSSSTAVTRVLRRHDQIAADVVLDVDVWTLGRSSAFVYASGTAGSPSHSARRRIGLLVALRLPTLPRIAAAIARRGIIVTDSSVVSGRDTSLSDCPPPDSSIAALAVAEAANVDTTACSHCLVGAPPVVVTPLAASVETYERFGQVDRSFLSSLAATIPSGTSLSPTPRLDAGGDCDAHALGNFGDPLRVLGADSPCASFVVLERAGGLQLVGGAGQGMLLVDGDLTLSGGARFDGVIIAQGDVRIERGARLTGLVLARQIAVSDGSIVRYSSCAVDRAIVAGARPIPQPGESWVEMF